MHRDRSGEQKKKAGSKTPRERTREGEISAASQRRPRPRPPFRPRPEPPQLEFEELFELQFDELFELELDELLLELLDEEFDELFDDEFEEEFDELLEDEFELELDELFELEFEELLLELFEEELLELLEARITRCAPSSAVGASRVWKLQPPRAAGSRRSAGCGAASALPPTKKVARAVSGPHAPRRPDALRVMNGTPVFGSGRLGRTRSQRAPARAIPLGRARLVTCFGPSSGEKVRVSAQGPNGAGSTAPAGGTYRPPAATSRARSVSAVPTAPERASSARGNRRRRARPAPSAQPSSARSANTRSA